MPAISENMRQAKYWLQSSFQDATKISLFVFLHGIREIRENRTVVSSVLRIIALIYAWPMTNQSSEPHLYLSATKMQQKRSTRATYVARRDTSTRLSVRVSADIPVATSSATPLPNCSRSIPFNPRPRSSLNLHISNLFSLPYPHNQPTCL